MFKKIIFLLTLICLYPWNAIASPTSQLTGLLQNLQTMQGSFNQTIQDTHGNVLQQSSGTMALQRPGLFRWETTTPNQQLIIADGKNIWIYDKDLQQVTKQKQNANGNTPGLLLSDDVDHLAKRFTIYNLNTDDHAMAFKLAPVQHDIFKAVELYFSSNGTLQQMVLYDNIGQITQIQFMNISTNTKLTKSLFQFQPPADVDVVSG